MRWYFHSNDMKGRLDKMIDELNEERIRQIAREEILRREMEKIGMLRKIEALAEKIAKERNENFEGVEI